MLISEVEARNKIFLAGSCKIWLSFFRNQHQDKKINLGLGAWENVALSVNEVGADGRTVADIRRKVGGHQGERKKKGLCPPEKRGSDGQRRRSRGARPI